jgi:N-methylhydantoinase A
MLLADRKRDYSVGVLGVGSDPGADATNEFELRFRRMEKQAGNDVRGATLERMADIRYAGQSYELTVPWRADRPSAAFHREHRRVYGYSDPNRPTQIVTLRVHATLKTERPSLRVGSAIAPGQAVKRRVWVAGRWRNVATGPREIVGRIAQSGPAVIVDYGSTTLVPPGWRMSLDSAGSLLLTS